MYFIYNLFLIFILPLFLIYFLCFSVRGNIRGTVRQRLGQIDFSTLPSTKKKIWVHAASVGEVRTAFELIRALRQKYGPSIKILLSVITQNGFEVAREETTLDALFYLPFDLPWIVKKVIHQIQPAILIVLETELWPNLFKYARQNGASIIVANGRLSQSSIKWYQRLRPLMRRVLSYTEKICVQNEIYYQRYQSIGAPPEKLVIVGDIKEEQAIHLGEQFPPAEVRQVLDFAEKPVLAVVSTHPGEEEQICEVFQALKPLHSQLKLILAPRHIFRRDTVYKLLVRYQFSILKRSEHEIIKNPTEDVILWDTFGELGRVYATATLVFVGGSLVPVGGHALMEPAAFGIPVLWGPHAFNFPIAAAKLIDCNGGICIQNQQELLTACQELLNSPDKSQKMGQAAHACAMSARGVIQRHLEWIEPSLGLKSNQ